ncbi:MAG: hypothetical protein PWQ30_1772 [Euryarchaeota archaeon]|jgi:hypothetical protein|nr:hypothetical protein [Euryarchaeota archaeon]
MTRERRARSWYLLIILAACALALAAPAAAQETAPRVVQPDETIEVGDEPIVLDLINLRDQETFNPVTELRKHRDDDPNQLVVGVIGVPNDNYFTIGTQALDGQYGRYYVYSEKDGLLREHSITFTPAPTATPTETATATAEETPTETAAATAATTVPTQAPFPGLIAVAAIGICGLLAAARKR